MFSWKQEGHIHHETEKNALIYSQEDVRWDIKLERLLLRGRKKSLAFFIHAPHHQEILNVWSMLVLEPKIWLSGFEIC